MPRFFFHAQDSKGVVRDECGVELPGWQAARNYALAAIRDIIADDVRCGQLSLEGYLRVTDATGALLFELQYNEAFQDQHAAIASHCAENDDEPGEKPNELRRSG